MPLSVQQFIENLSQTGLMSAADVSTLCDRLSEADRPVDAEALAKLLIRQGKLTRYQAQVIYSGKHQNLVFGEYVKEASGRVVRGGGWGGDGKPRRVAPGTRA